MLATIYTPGAHARSLEGMQAWGLAIDTPCNRHVLAAYVGYEFEVLAEGPGYVVYGPADAQGRHRPNLEAVAALEALTGERWSGIQQPCGNVLILQRAACCSPVPAY